MIISKDEWQEWQSLPQTEELKKRLMDRIDEAMSCLHAAAGRGNSNDAAICVGGVDDAREWVDFINNIHKEVKD